MVPMAVAIPIQTHDHEPIDDIARDDRAARPEREDTPLTVEKRRHPRFGVEASDLLELQRPYSVPQLQHAGPCIVDRPVELVALADEVVVIVTGRIDEEALLQEGIVE